MKIRDNKDESSNFWIAYADLMAGLLFVFILLIGAIVVKYVLTQSDLNRLKLDLSSKEESLKISNDKINQKEQAIMDFMQKLQAMQNQNLALSEINEIFNKRLDELNLELSDTNSTLSLVNKENEELNLTLSQKDLQIDNLKSNLDQIQTQYDTLLSDLNATKERLKSLGGIKVKVISDLKDKLGSDIRIDSDSGSISLPSSVLFDTNSFVLKYEARFDLRRTLSTYFDVLLSSDIRPNIDRITIEGHTDSDGSYLYNLELSQKRAYEVMKFIYSFYKDPDLQKYLIASGRSFSDLIYKNGAEDKEASRRIEIKFSISDKSAMQEINNILETKNR